MTFRLIFAIVMALGDTNVTNCMDDEGRLWRALFQDRDYNSKVRPVLNISSPVNITIDIALIQVIDFDEPRMVISSFVWMRVHWRDELLVWNASDYNGLTSILVPAEDVWLPDLTLYSSVVFPMDGVFGNKNFLVRLSDDGQVQWLFPSVTHSWCNVDMELFPFDTQRCEHEFGSWAYDGTQLDIHPMRPYGDRANFVDGGEWELVDLPSRRKVLKYGCCPAPFPSVIYTFVLRRRPMYYFFNMVLPCFLIMVVNMLSFFLPVESGEKITFDITTLLALVVFLRMVAEIIPPQAGVLPVIQFYFGLCILLLCLSTVVGVFVYRIHFAGEAGKPFPVWAGKVLYGPIGRALIFGQCACPNTQQSQESTCKIVKVKPADVRKTAGPVPARISRISGFVSGVHEATQTVNLGIKTSTDSTQTDFNENGVTIASRTSKGDWKHFAHFVDRVCFLLFVVVLFPVSCYLATFFV